MQTITPSSVYYVRSSRDPNRFYLITADERGILDCECPDRQYRRNHGCKHVRAIMRGDVKSSRMRPRPQPPAPPVRPAPRLTESRYPLAAVADELFS